MGLGITPTDDEEDWFISRLIHDEFTRAHAEKAELWCLRYKPWTYEGTKPRLTYPDLWPDALKLAKAIEGSETVLVEKATLERLHRLGRTNGGATDKNATARESAGKKGDSELTSLLVKINSEKMDLIVKLEERDDRIRQLETHLANAVRERDRLRKLEPRDDRMVDAETV